MMPDNDMGDPENNITTEKIIRAARAGGKQNVKEVVAQMLQTYNKKVKGTHQDTKPVV
jgi:hypothetical protein